MAGYADILEMPDPISGMVNKLSAFILIHKAA
jgi:hypothetical protein